MTDRQGRRRSQGSAEQPRVKREGQAQGPSPGGVGATVDPAEDPREEDGYFQPESSAQKGHRPEPD